MTVAPSQPHISRFGIGNRFRDVEQAPARALLHEEEAIRRFAHLSAVGELGKRARAALELP